jgi:hypothetical protein
MAPNSPSRMPSSGPTKSHDLASRSVGAIRLLFSLPALCVGVPNAVKTAQREHLGEHLIHLTEKSNGVGNQIWIPVSFISRDQMA